ncbi:hypothetical protein [Hydrogenophaga sp.]|jgi:hypothetical protein|uniref:hypothetical protein n=1 Tax=Hydrogenophaga sp. TaxID=1904254 RepID=UPI000BC65461|nr:hypothetical protein [Hydrogenophaga sp.]MDP1959015.1 hypothetical protein [Methylotenera sp.]MDP3885428.1 hypothetical protein [Hydrogenophaga sp.]OYZ39807.1 MAG: hypothetical protein B7Y16_08065 [Methylotenera sp. 24-45-7]HQR82990.1 hypothetical protein [Thiotrichales bacterium]
MQTNYPPIIGIKELSLLLKRTEAVVKRDRSDKDRKHTLPTGKRINNTKNPLWVTEDVINWLRQQPDDTDAPSDAPRRMGAPTKRERIEKRKAAEVSK